jgi:hypothetical protein
VVWNRRPLAYQTRRRFQREVYAAGPRGADLHLRPRQGPGQPGHGGIPLLTDALATLECEIVAEHPTGDHWIVVLVFFAGTSATPASDEHRSS